MKRLNYLKITCLAGMLILFLLLPACGSRIRVHEEDVEPMVKKEMEEKYGIDVDVLDMEFGSGAGNGVPSFGVGYYYVDASYDDKEFRVIVDNCSKEITDNYAKYLIGPAIEEIVQDAFETYNFTSISDYEYTIRYDCSEYKYTEKKDIARFFDKSESSIFIDVYLDGNDTDLIAEEIYTVSKDLENHGIHFCTDFYYKDNLIVIASGGVWGPMEHLEEIKQELSKID